MTEILADIFWEWLKEDESIGEFSKFIVTGSRSGKYVRFRLPEKPTDGSRLLNEVFTDCSAADFPDDADLRVLLLLSPIWMQSFRDSFWESANVKRKRIDKNKGFMRNVYG